MNGKYYILSLDRDADGKVIRQDLFGIPNGTPFYIPPIHINSAKDVIVCWANIDAEYFYLEHVSVIPTDVTNIISIPLLIKGFGITDMTINHFLINVFKDYAPHLDLS